MHWSSWYFVRLWTFKWNSTFISDGLNISSSQPQLQELDNTIQNFIKDYVDEYVGRYPVASHIILFFRYFNEVYIFDIIYW